MLRPSLARILVSAAPTGCAGIPRAASAAARSVSTIVPLISTRTVDPPCDRTLNMHLAVATILLVDDEPTLVATLDYNLRREGHEVVIARDGPSAIEQARKRQPDLVLLDVMLPKLDGFEVCRELRRTSTVPVLMLTAKDSEVDKVVVLEIGADDYMTKPFSMRELMARVKAMLRRNSMLAAAPSARGAEEVRLGELEIDTVARTVRRGGHAVHLKPKEFELLAFLAQNRGRVFTRDQLLENVWGYEFDGDTRTVDVHVRWLREKIEETPSQPRLLETVRGVGYRFAARCAAARWSGCWRTRPTRRGSPPTPPGQRSPPRTARPSRRWRCA